MESGGEVAPLLLLTSHEQRAMISVSTLLDFPPFRSVSSLCLPYLAVSLAPRGPCHARTMSSGTNSDLSGV